MCLVGVIAPLAVGVAAGGLARTWSSYQGRHIRVATAGAVEWVVGMRGTDGVACGLSSVVGWRGGSPGTKMGKGFL